MLNSSSVPAGPTNQKLGRVDEFDGLRGLLAFWVALSHIACWTGFAETTTKNRLLSFLATEFTAPTFAVETFLILSGFAISFLIHKKRQSYGTFITGRFFRLYPVYVTCLAAALITCRFSPFISTTASWRSAEYLAKAPTLHYFESKYWTSHFFLHLTMLHGVATRGTLLQSPLTFLPPAWSISLEWQYYLVAPLIAVLFRRAWGILLLLGISAVAIYFQKPWMNGMLAFLPPQLPLFLIGISSFHVFAWRHVNNRQAFVRSAIAFFAVFAFTLAVGHHKAALGVWAVVFAGTYFAGRAPRALGLAAVRRILLHPVLQWLGHVSYPLYLVHWPMLLAMLWAMLHVWPGLSQVQALLLLLGVGLPLILLTAELFHRYVEKPGMDLGKRIIEKPKPRPHAVSVIGAS